LGVLLKIVALVSFGVCVILSINSLVGILGSNLNSAWWCRALVKVIQASMLKTEELGELLVVTGTNLTRQSNRTKNSWLFARASLILANIFSRLLRR
jgi:hypothetical protein